MYLFIYLDRVLLYSADCLKLIEISAYVTQSAKIKTHAPLGPAYSATLEDKQDLSAITKQCTHSPVGSSTAKP